MTGLFGGQGGSGSRPDEAIGQHAPGQTRHGGSKCGWGRLRVAFFRAGNGRFPTTLGGLIGAGGDDGAVGKSLSRNGLRHGSGCR